MAISNNTRDTIRVHSGAGMSFGSLLAIVLITLKLAEIGDVATWSWWIVLLPLYLLPTIGLGLWIIAVVLMLILAGITAYDKSKTKNN